MKRSWLYLLLNIVVVLSLLLVACAPKQVSAPAGEPVKLIAGSLTTTSKYYTYAAAIASLVNTHAKGVEITVVESGGGLDNQKRLQAGEFDFTLVGSVPSEFEAYGGFGNFDKPFRELRLVLILHPSVFHWYVTKSSGIEWFRDLSGSKLPWSPGTPGSTVSNMGMAVAEVLGVKLNIFQGAWTDTVSAVQDRRAIGFGLSGLKGKADASLVDIHRTNPLTVIGLTEEEMNKCKASGKLDSFGWMKTGVGEHELAPDRAFWQLGGGVDVNTTTKVPQEAVYEIVKAVYENYGTINTVYQDSQGVDPIKVLIEYMDRGSESIPLHAGVVQYCKEIGIHVPDYFIPPEYKE